MNFEKLENEKNLLDAVEDGDLAAVKEAVEAGADIEITYKRVYPNSLTDGPTPFLLAVVKGQLEVAKYLAAVGANVLVKDENGADALCYLSPDRDGVIETFVFLIGFPELLALITKRRELVKNLFKIEPVNYCFDSMWDYEDN